MIEESDIKKIKDSANEFFEKMTITALSIEADFSSAQGEISDVVNLNIKLDEPQILIGQNGQTLSEAQRILRMVLNKKLQKIFYLNIDINNYKAQKMDYLKRLAKDLADEVVFNKEEKVLFPMPSYERRVIHAELAGRTDVITESRGDGPDRHIVIKPK